MNPIAGIILSRHAALLTSIAISITKEYISKSKLRCTKPRDWIIVLTLLYAKTPKQSMVDEKTDDKEIKELKKVYNHHLDKRGEILKENHFKVENVFGDILNEDSISPAQITKINFFQPKLCK